jgi:hypothetical protein
MVRMLSRRSASLISSTLMSRAMATTILRMVSAWAASRVENPIRSSLVSPSVILPTSGPNSSWTSSRVMAVSSTTSCSSEAVTLVVSRPRSTTISATRSGWATNGSPDLRRWSPWRSRATSQALRTSATSAPARRVEWRRRRSSGSGSGSGGGTWS